MILKTAQRPRVCASFWKIVEKNKGKSIVLILDNSRAHHPKKTVTKARELGISLVFLPPYSPDLGPRTYLEIYKKRSISEIYSIKHLRNVTRGEFQNRELLSFAKKWIENIINRLKV